MKTTTDLLTTILQTTSPSELEEKLTQHVRQGYPLVTRDGTHPFLLMQIFRTLSGAGLSDEARSSAILATINIYYAQNQLAPLKPKLAELVLVLRKNHRRLNEIIELCSAEEQGKAFASIFCAANRQDVASLLRGMPWIREKIISNRAIFLSFFSEHCRLSAAGSRAHEDNLGLLNLTETFVCDFAEGSSPLTCLPHPYLVDIFLRAQGTTVSVAELPVIYYLNLGLVGMAQKLFSLGARLADVLRPDHLSQLNDVGRETLNGLLLSPMLCIARHEFLQQKKRGLQAYRSRIKAQWPTHEEKVARALEREDTMEILERGADRLCKKHLQTLVDQKARVRALQRQLAQLRDTAGHGEADAAESVKSLSVRLQFAQIPLVEKLSHKLRKSLRRALRTKWLSALKPYLEAWLKTINEISHLSEIDQIHALAKIECGLAFIAWQLKHFKKDIRRSIDPVILSEIEPKADHIHTLQRYQAKGIRISEEAIREMRRYPSQHHLIFEQCKEILGYAEPDEACSAAAAAVARDNSVDAVFSPGDLHVRVTAEDLAPRCAKAVQDDSAAAAPDTAFSDSAAASAPPETSHVSIIAEDSASRRVKIEMLRRLQRRYRRETIVNTKTPEKAAEATSEQTPSRNLSSLASRS